MSDFFTNPFAPRTSPVEPTDPKVVVGFLQGLNVLPPLESIAPGDEGPGPANDPVAGPAPRPQPPLRKVSLQIDLAASQEWASPPKLTVEDAKSRWAASVSRRETLSQQDARTQLQGLQDDTPEVSSLDADADGRSDLIEIWEGMVEYQGQLNREGALIEETHNFCFESQSTLVSAALPVNSLGDLFLIRSQVEFYTRKVRQETREPDKSEILLLLENLRRDLDDPQKIEQRCQQAADAMVEEAEVNEEDSNRYAAISTALKRSMVSDRALRSQISILQAGGSGEDQSRCIEILEEARSRIAEIDGILRDRIGQHMPAASEGGPPPSPQIVIDRLLESLDGSEASAPRSPVEGEVDAARILVQEAGGRWQALVEQYGDDFRVMTAAAAYRKAVVDGWLHENAGRFWGLQEGPGLGWLSTGSTNLTSDYDVTINAHGTAGGQTVYDWEIVKRFNQEIRRQFGADPSIVFDTNFYASASIADIGTSEGDAEARSGSFAEIQRVAALMKLRRSMSKTDFDAFETEVLASLKDADDEQAYASFERQFETARHNLAIAEQEVAERIARDRAAGRRPSASSSSRLSDRRGSTHSRASLAGDSASEFSSRRGSVANIHAQNEQERLAHEVILDHPDDAVRASNDLYVQAIREVRETENKLKTLLRLKAEAETVDFGTAESREIGRQAQKTAYLDPFVAIKTSTRSATLGMLDDQIQRARLDRDARLTLALVYAHDAYHSASAFAHVLSAGQQVETACKLEAAAETLGRSIAIAPAGPSRPEEEVAGAAEMRARAADKIRGEWEWARARILLANRGQAFIEFDASQQDRILAALRHDFPAPIELPGVVMPDVEPSSDAAPKAGRRLRIERFSASQREAGRALLDSLPDEERRREIDKAWTALLPAERDGRIRRRSDELRAKLNLGQLLDSFNEQLGNFLSHLDAEDERPGSSLIKAAKYLGRLLDTLLLMSNRLPPGHGLAATIGRELQSKAALDRILDARKGGILPYRDGRPIEDKEELESYKQSIACNYMNEQAGSPIVADTIGHYIGLGVAVNSAIMALPEAAAA